MQFKQLLRFSDTQTPNHPPRHTHTHTHTHTPTLIHTKSCNIKQTNTGFQCFLRL